MWTDLPPLLKEELEKPENVDIYNELTDNRFASRQHYSRATYAQGCRGPLCRKAERDRGRKRTEKKAEDAGREYQPNPEIRTDTREGLLNLIINWHLHHPDAVQRRMEARAV